MANLFNISKIIKRLDAMIDNAVSGKNTDTIYDESKMSALEHKLNRYLAITKTKLDEQAKEKNNISSLISDISHQTKTPLSNIMLYSQLLSELSEQNDIEPQTRELISEIAAQSEKLSFLIDSLVKISRLETGIITTNKTVNSVCMFLQTAAESIKNKANDKNIEISIDCIDTITSAFDEKWTAEAVVNILDNAVKYSPENGKIEISAIQYEMFTRIDIKDFGIGIAENEINLIFQRFYRSLDVNKYEGVGIGLYLARKIISVQGGYIKVASVLSKGSTFSVFLPNV